MISEYPKCAICRGEKDNFFGDHCHFCNNSGKWNPAAESFMKYHTCYCQKGDRKTCDLCGKRCHHDCSLRAMVLCC
jgi:hypothetical protein